MELRHLRYFVAAAEEENFHRAAERLHVTQSALSRRIRDLEVELGVDLFDRSQKRVRLSSVGRAYLEDAVRILKDIEAANSRGRRIARGELGTLSFALNDTVVRHDIVSKAFHSFRLGFPNVELKLDPTPWPSLVAALTGGNVDAAFLYSRPADSPLFDHIAIATDEFLLALPSSHPLADKPEIRLRDLREQNFLWMTREPAPDNHDRLISACQAGGLTPRIVQYLMSESARLHLVSAGMGITFITSSFRNYSVENVVTRKLADFSMALTLELAWRRDNRSLTLSHFVELMKSLTREPGLKPEAAPRSKSLSLVPDKSA
jgi:DNA-binding transcriptional LysR family regulator